MGEGVKKINFLVFLYGTYHLTFNGNYTFDMQVHCKHCYRTASLRHFNWHYRKKSREFGSQLFDYAYFGLYCWMSAKKFFFYDNCKYTVHIIQESVLIRANQASDSQLSTNCSFPPTPCGRAVL